MSDFEAWRKACEKAKGGPKQPYEDETCDHQYVEDEDALELVCSECGDRQQMDLGDLMK